MKINHFKYQITTKRLWYHNAEITNKQANNPRDWLFVLKPESPRQWIRLKLKKDESWLKVFAKQPDKQGKPHYFAQWHQITDLTKPLSFQLTPTDEVTKQADGRWVKITAEKYD